MPYKLEKMEINGFKSFFARSELTFPGSITAVVGPNGCGKSNISDAISWVLGEQSAKSLRGKKMEDIIFNGTESRQPLGMANVTLRLVPAGEPAKHGKGGEIEITRRLYRSGESEYLLNGSRCRLKDIRDFLFSRGLGNADTAVIEQGSVEEIISNRSQERRTLIENAAGISGYKNKKRIAEGRLEAARTNLVTIATLAGELERQLRSLRRQAGAARRHAGLVERWNASRRLVISLEHARQTAERQRLGARREEAENRLAGEAGGLARCETQVEGARSGLEERQARLRGDREAAHRREVELQRLESQLAGLRQSLDDSHGRCRELEEERTRLGEAERDLAGRRATAEQRRALLEEELRGLAAESARREEEHGRALTAVTSLEGDKAAQAARRMEVMDLLLALRNQLRALERDRLTLRGGLERLDLRLAEAEEARRRLAEEEERVLSESDGLRLEAGRGREAEGLLAAETSAAAERAERLGQNLQRLRLARLSLAERAELLEGMITRRADFSASVQRLLTAAPPEIAVRLRGALADVLQVEPGDERMVERFLGERLEWVLVDGREAVPAVKAWLGESGVPGPVTLLPLDGGAEPAAPAEEEADAWSLAGRVRVPEACRLAVSPLLRGVRLVGSLAEGLTLTAEGQGACLTGEGDLVRRGGEITCWGGQEARLLAADEEGEQRSWGPLALRRQAEVLRARLEQAAGEERELEAAAVAAAEESRGREEALALLSRSLREQEARLARLEAAGERLGASLGENRRLEGGLAAERQRLAGELSALEGEEAALAPQAAERERQVEELTAEGERLREREAGLRRELEELRAALEAARTRLAAGEEKRRSLAETLAGLEEAQGGLGERTRRIDAGREAEERRQARLAGEIGAGGEELAAELEALDGDRRRVAEGERECEGLAGEAARLEGEVKERRRRVEEARQAKEELDLELARLDSQIGFLEKEHRENFARELEAIPAERLAELEAGAADPLEGARAEAARLQARIQRLGPVNMRAIEECEEVEKRFGFVSEQKRDIEESIGSLETTIRRINVTSRRRFQEALERINAAFGETFRDFFGGGTARISIPEGEDLLEADVEIAARPPGKKTQDVLLLSGGEKALTAIAFLFAVLRYRPSPFCFLDEVDAALDDANVDRFLRLLREMSRETQFVVITHNKVTMECADLLYGVTMEEPGISKLVSVSLNGNGGGNGRGGGNGHGRRAVAESGGGGGEEGWEAPLPERRAPGRAPHLTA